MIGSPGLGLDELAVEDYKKKPEGVGAYTGAQGSLAGLFSHRLSGSSHRTLIRCWKGFFKE